MRQLTTASQLMAAHRYLDAEKALLDALAARPDNAFIHAELARCRLSIDDREHEAVRSAREAVRLAPDHAWPYYILAIALTRVGDEDMTREADKVINASLRLDPENSHAWLLRATLSEAVDRDEEVEPALKRALALDPQEPDNLVAMARWKMKRGQDEAARRLLTEALRLDPMHAAAHKHLSTLMLGRGRARAALRHAQEAARLAPGAEDAQAVYWDAQAAQGGLLGWLATFNAVLRRAPRWVFGQYWDHGMTKMMMILLAGILIASMRDSGPGAVAARIA